MTNEVTHKIEGNVLHIERTFDAPVELVFDAWTNEDALKEWWSPEGFTIPVSKMDFREGGQWHYMMLGGPDMGDFANFEAWGLAKFVEIDPPKKLVWENGPSNPEGTFNPEFPHGIWSAEFNETDGKTTVISRLEHESEEAVVATVNMGMIEGHTSALIKLDNYLAHQLKNA